jgi:3-deoxy-D-manno-octulosonic-acid transferase
MLKWFVFALYSLGIHLGNLYIFLGSFISPKLKTLYSGRKKTLHDINSTKTKFHNAIWIHCASLGEFEQGRPLMEAIKAKYPQRKVILSFFSPSGLEIRKNYEWADHIFYLPSDLSSNADKLIHHFQPEIFILVKYEFWWNLLNALSNTKCRVYLIAGVFRKSDYFFKPIFGHFIKILKKFECIFVQDELSRKVLVKNDVKHVNVVGDTRIDRVVTNAANIVLDDQILQFVDDHITIVYGSIWSSDMAIVSDMIKRFPAFKHIIAPHDISFHNIKTICGGLPFRFSLYSDVNLESKILIIDNIGMLSKLYKTAKYVYIGGGFQKGIHNILEPTVFNVPVFFGPKYQKFNEAVDLCAQGASFSIKSPIEMIEKVEYFEKHSEKYIANGLVLKKYFDKNKGSTDKIVAHLSHYLSIY